MEIGEVVAVDLVGPVWPSERTHALASDSMTDDHSSSAVGGQLVGVGLGHRPRRAQALGDEFSGPTL
jgi:hypothetical protein